MRERGSLDADGESLASNSGSRAVARRASLSALAAPTVLRTLAASWPSPRRTSMDRGTGAGACGFDPVPGWIRPPLLAAGPSAAWRPNSRGSRSPCRENILRLCVPLPIASAGCRQVSLAAPRRGSGRRWSCPWYCAGRDIRDAVICPELRVWPRADPTGWVSGKVQRPLELPQGSAAQDLRAERKSIVRLTISWVSCLEKWSELASLPDIRMRETRRFAAGFSGWRGTPC